MPINICPSLFYIAPDKNTKPYNKKDIFLPDRFKILQAENITHVKEIVANTGAKQALQVRLLCCYRMKGLPQSYCTHRYVENPQKQICAGKSGLKTKYIHFHVKMKNSYDDEYFLAFIEDSDLDDNRVLLVEELLCTITWLGISSQQIYLKIFTIGEPVFPTRNISHSDNNINIEIKKLKYKHQGNIDYNITHLNQEHNNRLSVSLKKKHLTFQPS